MLRLVRQALLQRFSLSRCLARWFSISSQLRESPRKRRTQQECLQETALLLS